MMEVHCRYIRPMNRLKSIFLPVFLVFTVVVLFLSALAVASGSNLTIWVSVFAASAQVAVYFAWLHLVKVPRTSPGLVGFTVGIFLATMYGVFASYDQQSPSIGPLLSFVLMVGWMGYVVWHSDLGERTTDRIKVGKKLPVIYLETLEGRKTGSDEWLGQKRLVVFYCGNWSPICTAQLAELGKYRNRFDETGVRITAISPQPLDKTRELAQRLGPSFELLSDPGNEAAKKLGILNESVVPMGLSMFGYGADVPMPSVFVLDAKGKVLYADLTQNFRLRPLPADILKALDEAAS